MQSAPVNTPGRSSLGEALAALLADLSGLAARTRTYQWNVVGPQFVYLQEAFRRQHTSLQEMIELLGERIRALGGVVAGELTDLAARCRLPARPRQPAARDMVTGLLADHETQANQVRIALLTCGSDRVSADLLADLLARHEQMARGLRAFVESPVDTSGQPPG